MKKYNLLFALFCSIFAFAQSYDIKLNLKKGQNYEMMQVVDMNMLQNFQGQEIPVKVKGNVGVLCKVVDAKPNSYVLDTQFTYISTAVDAMGNKINFDTKSNSDHEVAQSLKKMINRNFKIEISAKGKILNITGNKEIQNQIKKELGTPDASMEKFLEMYNDNAIKQTFEAVYTFPEKAVKKGDQWKGGYITNSGYNVQNDVTYTLEDVDNTHYTVNYTADVKTLPAQVMEQNGMKMMPDLKGKTVGSFKLKRESGWISFLETEGKMTGDITMIDMGNAKIQMEMTTNMNYFPISEPTSPPALLPAK